jgi:hypothetical protein
MKMAKKIILVVFLLIALMVSGCVWYGGHGHGHGHGYGYGHDTPPYKHHPHPGWDRHIHGEGPYRW